MAASRCAAGLDFLFGAVPREDCHLGALKVVFCPQAHAGHYFSETRRHQRDKTPSGAVENMRRLGLIRPRDPSWCPVTLSRRAARCWPSAGLCGGQLAVSSHVPWKVCGRLPSRGHKGPGNVRASVHLSRILVEARVTPAVHLHGPAPLAPPRHYPQVPGWHVTHRVLVGRGTLVGQQEVRPVGSGALRIRARLTRPGSTSRTRGHQAGGHTPFLWPIMLMYPLLPASVQWLHLDSGCRPTARKGSRRIALVHGHADPYRDATGITPSGVRREGERGCWREVSAQAGEENYSHHCASLNSFFTSPCRDDPAVQNNSRTNTEYFMCSRACHDAPKKDVFSDLNLSMHQAPVARRLGVAGCLPRTAGTSSAQHCRQRNQASKRHAQECRDH